MTIDVNIYNNVQLAISALEMQKILESSYENTSQIKENKVIRNLTIDTVD